MYLSQQIRKHRAVTVASCAVASRIATVALMVVASKVLPTHKATGVHLFHPAEYPPTRAGEGGSLAAFTRWDSAWFLSIADSGYPAARSSVQSANSDVATASFDCTGTNRAWGGTAYKLEMEAEKQVHVGRCDADVALQEQAHAFFPFYPWLVRTAGNGLSLLSESLGQGDRIILGAVIISNGCFIAASVLLYHLGRVVTGDSLLAFRGALVFCATPASVFFSTGYAESLYAVLTFAGLLSLFRAGIRRGVSKNNADSQIRFRSESMVENSTSSRGWQVMVHAWVAAVFFAAATLTRSNGIAGVVVLVLEKLRWIAEDAGLFLVHSGSIEPAQGMKTNVMEKNRRPNDARPAYGATTWSTLPWIRILASLVATGLQALLIILPYVLVQVYAFRKFCVDYSAYGAKASSRRTELHPWCAWRVPSLYSYIQSKYWNVGAFKYYEWKQMPNFVLAAPVLALTAFGVAQFFIAQFEKQGSNSSVRETGGALENDESEQLSLCRTSWYQRVARIFFGRPMLPHPAARPFERSGAASLVLQWALLATFAAMFMNIQVATRFLAAACPPLHWWTANALFPPRMDSGKASCAIRSCLKWYFVIYFTSGSVAHAIFLPWT